ncbi:MAG: hypothetical protein GQ544_05110 [Candidatus Aminicenantes bacterium]|nr:hypothetical protein [Candidatus Aminicenantes bacterium]
MTLAKLAPLALSLFLLASMVSISASQIFLGLAFIFWLILLFRSKQKPGFPGFFWALLAFALLTLISCVMSDNPAVSFHDSRSLLILLIVPLVYSAFQQKKQIRLANLALLVSAFISLTYSFVYFLVKAAPGERIAGFMGHYMTQAGLLILICALALSMFIFTHGKMRYLWGSGFVLAAAGSLLTITRSAWIGIVVVVFVILLLYKPKALILVPAVVLVVYFLSPQPVKRRAMSIFDTKVTSNKLRIEYFGAGLKIIRDYPVFGTGPNTVHVIFQRPQYGLSEEARDNVHLHNNFIQIAAERGIPTMLAWVAFLVWALFALVKQLKNKDPSQRPYSAAALAALLGMVVAGLFEYNFGDSEVVTLFLYLLTLPFAWEFLSKSHASG